MTAHSKETTISNKLAFKDILATARELGEQAGKGADTQVKFLIAAIEGGYHGALDLTADKHADTQDDATALAESYVKARQGAVVFDAKAPNQRKLISTVRLGIRLGTWPDGGTGEPLATVNNLMTKRLHYKRVPDTSTIVDDATNTLLKYARAQLKRNALIPDEELDAFCFRPARKTRDAGSMLKNLLGSIDHLIAGDEARGIEPLTNPNVVKARNMLRKELAKLTPEAEGTGNSKKPPVEESAGTKGGDGRPDVTATVKEAA